MRMPELPLHHDFPDTLKGWEAKEKNRAEWYAFWEWMRNRRFHALPDEKGTPVPGTGVRRYRKSVNGAGVSANSRILPHRYADEGEKGKAHRKQIRHAEEMLWRADWVAEGYDVEEASTVAQWFYDNSDDTDSDIIPDVYTVGETVVEWPNDEYGYAYDSYDYYLSDYDREMMGEYPDYGYCDYCCGPCEL